MKLVCWLFFFMLPVGALAQLSSSDIRTAVGCGPFPIYLNLQYSPFSGKIDPLRQLSRQYQREFANNATRRSYLKSLELNMGLALNLPGLSGLAIESGIRGSERPWQNVDGDKLIKFKEEAISLRFSYRGTIFYPITYQVQVGPYLMHRVRLQNTEGASPNTWRRDADIGEAWEGRLRLLFLDPVGTPGGLGVYIEARHTRAGEINMAGMQQVLGLSSSNDAKAKWNYTTYSIGFVTPLALRIRRQVL